MHAISISKCYIPIEFQVCLIINTLQRELINLLDFLHRNSCRKPPNESEKTTFISVYLTRKTLNLITKKALTNQVVGFSNRKHIFWRNQ